MQAVRPKINPDDRKEKCGVTLRKSLVITAKEKAAELKVSFSAFGTIFRLGVVNKVVNDPLDFTTLPTVAF